MKLVKNNILFSKNNKKRKQQTSTNKKYELIYVNNFTNNFINSQKQLDLEIANIINKEWFNLLA